MDDKPSFRKPTAEEAELIRKLIAMNKPASWRSQLDERQLKEVELAVIYAENFHHGTTGHNQLMLIAQMAKMLDERDSANGGNQQERQ